MYGLIRHVTHHLMTGKKAPPFSISFAIQTQIFNKVVYLGNNKE